MKFKFLLQLLWTMSKTMFRAILINTVLLGVLYAADDLSAQSVKSIREVAINLDLKNSALAAVFDAIEAKTDYRFTYKSEDLDKKVRISGEFHNLSVADILLEVAKRGHLKFRQIDDNIHVSRHVVKKKGRDRVESNLDIVVTGKVRSAEENEGLTGVNVIVKGTLQGTITDVDGNYRIEVPSLESILQFTSVGYIKEEVVVGNQTVIDIVMAPDVTALEEIVVIGYGTQQKRDLTGAVSSVSGEEIREVAVPGFDRAIAGKVAGVNISSSNAAPGGGNTILIRGYSSLSADSDPLIVLDGFPLNDNFSKSENPLNSINPNDIESIDILKDASATAIPMLL